MKPDYAEAYFNRGDALAELKQPDAAIRSFDKAIAIKPGYAKAHWNKALSLLLSGDFRNGWELFEWRWCPLMSLPLAFKTEVPSIPAPRAYLRSDPDKHRYWRNRLGESRKLRVGLVWAGGFRPAQPETWATNRRRNIDLSRLAVLRDERIEFFSLQKGPSAESDLASVQASSWNGAKIVDYTSDLDDFSDTAALADNLDLVISVDTSSAHLVGALGKPIWILNRYDTCWRWLLDGEVSPWYPTVRLYRQERPGDWDSVLMRVKSDLERLVT